MREKKKHDIFALLVRIFWVLERSVSVTHRSAKSSRYVQDKSQK